jgi:hypothetical protein
MAPGGRGGYKKPGGEVLKLMGVPNLHRKLSFHRYLSPLKLVVNLARIRV